MGPEKKLENKIKKWLDAKGIYYFKYHGNSYSRAGIADMTICVNGKFVACELKSDVGKLTELQHNNLNKVVASGGIAIVVRPKSFDYFKKRVEELLDATV